MAKKRKNYSPDQKVPILKKHLVDRIPLSDTDNNPKSPARSLLFVWLVAILLITITMSAVMTAILLYYRSTDIMEAADARLLVAAEMSREIVGPNYHDQIDNPSSVSEEQFRHIVERNDNLCRRLGLQYLWSVLQIRDKSLVFTSATHSDINDAASPCASFFETHRDPLSFTLALVPEMNPSFSSFHNEWGSGRQVLVPWKDSRGRTYIFGASIQLARYDAIVYQSLMAAFAIWVVVMCFALPAALYLSRRLTAPIAGLTKAVDRMATGDLDTTLPAASYRELQSLSHSFDLMRRELKQQTEDLRESEHRHRSLLSQLPIGVYRNSPGRSGQFIMANEAIARMFGYESPDQFIRTKVSELYMDPSERESFSKRLIRQGRIDAAVLRLKKKDGSPFWASVTAVVVHNNQGGIEYFDGIIEDITERKRAEEALRDSEEKYRSLVEATSDWIWEIDKKGTYTYSSPKVTELLGYKTEEIIGKTPFDFMPPEEKKRVSDIFNRMLSAHSSFESFENIILHKNGSHVILETSGVPILNRKGKLLGYRGVNRDITERKALENQLLQAQKMEAIGRLAGGVAHDFNNILSAILGYAELALMERSLEPPIKNKLSAIQFSGKRARDLVNQILAFSRMEEQVRTPIEIGLILKDALKLLRPAIPATIDIQTHISVECSIIGDPTRVHQILMNLVTNAYQAMLKTGGTLFISLTRVDLKSEAAKLAQIPDGEYGKLTVSDTGVGIPADDIDRIFEPYFTTKVKGKGTGLGLATVHGIVKTHGGTISVESQIGQGTTFEVYLPLALESEVQEQKETSRLLGGNERILLVDDEPDILEIEKEMLEKLGYCLKVADNAREALQLFTQEPDQFDLVITDMTMPGMTGDKLAGELRKIHSNIPIILCTGFSELISSDKATSLGINGFVMKPVGLKALSTVIRNTLDKAAI